MPALGGYSHVDGPMLIIACVLLLALALGCCCGPCCGRLCDACCGGGGARGSSDVLRGVRRSSARVVEEVAPSVYTKEEKGELKRRLSKKDVELKAKRKSGGMNDVAMV